MEHFKKIAAEYKVSSDSEKKEIMSKKYKDLKSDREKCFWINECTTYAEEEHPILPKEKMKKLTLILSPEQIKKFETERESAINSAISYSLKKINFGKMGINDKIDLFSLIDENKINKDNLSDLLGKDLIDQTVNKNVFGITLPELIGRLRQVLLLEDKINSSNL